MAEMSELLHGKTGGVPNSVLILTVGAGVGYLWWKKRQGSTASSNNGTASDGSTSVSGQAPAEFIPTTPPTDSSNPSGNTPHQTFTDNTAWFTAVVSWFTAHPQVMVELGTNPVSIAISLNNYLNNVALSNTDQAVINRAFIEVGPPPFPPSGTSTQPPAPPTAPPPTPPPPVSSPAPSAPPPAQRTYTVQHGDTLWSIAVHFYGSGSQWTRIYNANLSRIRNPNLIYPGQVLVIP